MTRLKSRWVRGNLVFWEGHRHRIVDAIGPNVKKYELKAEDLNADGTDPTGWTSTVAEVGAGTTEFSPGADAGYVGTITCAGNENDGGNYQLLGPIFVPDGARDIYMGVGVKINDVDQTDILFGGAVVDTDLLGAVADAIYLESLDGAASVSTVTEVGSAETQNNSLATLVDATDHILEFNYLGADDKVLFFVDGIHVSTHTAGIPDDEVLRLSLHFLTGEAVANTCAVKWMRAFEIP